MQEFLHILAGEDAVLSSSPALFKDYMGTAVINDISLGHVPDIANTYSGNVIILGGARCIYEDYYNAKELMPTCNLIGVNDISGQFKEEEIQHAVSLHIGILPAIKLLRKEKSLLNKIITHSTIAGNGVDVVWDMANPGGTSGLFAVKLAIVLGYTKIIICGIPMDNTGHYFDAPEDKRKSKEIFGKKVDLAPWNDMPKSKIVMDRVRAMGGHPATLFGKPTKEWVAS